LKAESVEVHVPIKLQCPRTVAANELLPLRKVKGDIIRGETERGEEPPYLQSIILPLFREHEWHQDAWHDQSYSLPLYCDFQRNMVLLRWLLQKRARETFLKANRISYSENHTMHKVETAGHAGTELGLPRLCVLKLLIGRAATGGAQGLRMGDRLS
jgi:hypothetical protein